jgi:hypothetical protein
MDERLSTFGEGLADPSYKVRAVCPNASRAYAEAALNSQQRRLLFFPAQCGEIQADSNPSFRTKGTGK